MLGRLQTHSVNLHVNFALWGDLGRHSETDAGKYVLLFRVR
jgi:hypothetical protein